MRTTYNLHYIYYIIFLYPFLYVGKFFIIDANYSFANYFFGGLLIYLFIVNYSRLRLLTIRRISEELFFFIALIFLMLLNSGELNYLKPIFFFAYFINLYVYSYSKPDFDLAKISRQYFKVYICLSIVFLFDSSSYFEVNRFMGFMLSPTVFSVYAEVFIILVICYDRRFKNRIVYFLIGFSIVLLTRTRLNIMFISFVPFLIYGFEKVKLSKRTIFVLFIILLNAVYPLYSYIIKFNFAKSTLVSSRYSSGRDASFGLRNYLNDVAFNEFLYHTTFQEKLFGRGTEEARKLIMRKTQIDLLPHNDFIRFTLDFGIIATCFLLILLYKICVKNYVSFILLLLYLFSFYHNMIYDFFLLSVIVISAVNPPLRKSTLIV